MTSPNIIAELLRRGALPTDEDATSLREIGSFTALLLSRYAETKRRDVGGGSHRMVASLATSRGGVGQAGRWIDGIGMGALVDDEFWQSMGTSALPANGYGDIDTQIETLSIMDEDGVVPSDDVVTRTPVSAARRPGLFGRQRPVAPLPKVRSPDERRAIAASANAAQSPGKRRLWSLGGDARVSTETLRFLTEGGLPLIDQVIRAERARTGAFAGAASLQYKSSASPLGLAASATIGSGAAGLHGRRVSLDGLTVDNRLPALAASLMEANTSRFAPARMGVEAPATGPGEGRVPSYAFFDAAENTFLTLDSAQESSRITSDMSSANEASGGGSGSRRPGFDSGRGRFAPSAAAGNSRVGPRATSITKDPGALAVRLQDIVSPGSTALRVPTTSIARAALAFDTSGFGGFATQMPTDVAENRGQAVKTSLGDARVAGVEGFAPNVPVGTRHSPREQAFFASAISYRPDASAAPRESRSSVGGALRLMSPFTFDAQSFEGNRASREASASGASGPRGAGFTSGGTYASPAQQLAVPWAESRGEGFVGGLVPDQARGLPIGQAPLGREQPDGAVANGAAIPFGTNLKSRNVGQGAARWFDGPQMHAPMPLGASFTANEAFTIGHIFNIGVGQNPSVAERFAPLLAGRGPESPSPASRRDWVDSAVDGAVWLTLDSTEHAVSGADASRHLGLSVVPERANAVQVPARAAVRGLMESARNVAQTRSEREHASRLTTDGGVAGIGRGRQLSSAVLNARSQQEPRLGEAGQVRRVQQLKAGDARPDFGPATSSSADLAGSVSLVPSEPLVGVAQLENRAHLPDLLRILRAARLPTGPSTLPASNIRRAGAQSDVSRQTQAGIGQKARSVANPVDFSTATGRSVWAPLVGVDTTATTARTGTQDGPGSGRSEKSAVSTSESSSLSFNLFAGAAFASEGSNFSSALKQIAKARHAMLRPVPTAREALEIMRLGDGLARPMMAGLLGVEDGSVYQRNADSKLGTAAFSSIGEPKNASSAFMSDRDASLDAFGVLAQRLGGGASLETTPSLARVLAARAARMKSAAGLGVGGADMFLEAVRTSVGASAPAVREMLMKQGWSSAELDLLVQDASGEYSVAAEQEGLASRAARPAIGASAARNMGKAPIATETSPGQGRAESIRDMSVEGVPGAQDFPLSGYPGGAMGARNVPAAQNASSSAAVTDRFARNLARTLTGALAVGGSSAAGAGGPSVANAVARQQASIYLGTLAGRAPDPYFGTSAPAAGLAGRLSRSVGSRRLADEVSELAESARGDALRSNSPLPAAARRQLAANLRVSETMIAGLSGRGSAARPDDVGPMASFQALLAARDDNALMSFADIDASLVSSGVVGSRRQRIHDSLVGKTGMIEAGAHFEPQALKAMVARELGTGERDEAVGGMRALAQRGIISSALADRMELGEFLTMADIETGLNASGLGGDERNSVLASLRSSGGAPGRVPVAQFVQTVEQFVGADSAKRLSGARSTSRPNIGSSNRMLDALNSQSTISVIDTAERAASFGGEGGLRALAERGVVPMALADRMMLGEFVSAAEVEAVMTARGASPEVRRSVLEALKAQIGNVAAPRTASAKGEMAGRQGKTIADVVGSATDIGQGASKTLATAPRVIAERGVDSSRTGFSATDAAAGWRLLSERGVNPLHLGEVDMNLVAAEVERQPDGAVIGLGGRIAGAMALSASGPAGAARLAGGAARAGSANGLSESQAERPAGTTSAVGAALDASAKPARSAGVAPRGYAKGWSASVASIGEERTRNLPISLNSVLSPEVMMSGIRSLEVTKAIRDMSIRGATAFEDLGVLTTLADSGIDLAAGRTATAPGGPALGDVMSGGSEREALVARMVARAERSGGSAAGSALSEILLKGADPVEAVSRAKLNRRERAGLLSSILRGTERAETASIFEGAGAADFAFIWLARVDGSKSGIDVGMGQVREATARTFGARVDGSKSGIGVGMGQARDATARTLGARRDSRVAMTSPMADANLVASAAPRSASMAGSQVAPHARGVASAMAGKSSHSDAIRRTDWRLVDTGAKGGTSHADLGKLASALVSNRGVGPAAVPMALVAPAAKSVAQMALRSERGDQAASSAPAPDPSATSGPAGAGDFSLSEEALELLAVEMAGLVAEIFESEKQRTGQSW